MNKAGRSVLWFLAGCLIFTQGITSIAANYGTPIAGEWLLVFGFASLLIVLSALFLMFKINPAFITAEHNDLVPLSLIQHVASNTNNPKLLGQLIASISPEIWKNGGPDIDDELEENEANPSENVDESEEDDLEEQDSIENALSALTKNNK